MKLAFFGLSKCETTTASLWDINRMTRGHMKKPPDKRAFNKMEGQHGSWKFYVFSTLVIYRKYYCIRLYDFTETSLHVW